MLWNKPQEKGVYPKIRVIAETASWSAQNCEIENKEVGLIGLEHTRHSIEAQFNENSDFIHIATSDAYYQSKLSFDHVGKITGRKVLDGDSTCKYFGEIFGEFDDTDQFWNISRNKKEKCLFTLESEMK